MTQANWFRTDPLSNAITRLRESGLGCLHAANLWLLEGGETSLLIDAGVGLAPLRPVVEGLTDRPVACLLTHGHYDHMGGGWEFDTRLAHLDEAAILADPTPEATQWKGWLTERAFSRMPHPGFSMESYRVRPAPPTRYVDDTERLDLGGRTVTILHVPGHAPGLLAVYEEASRTLFTSDALYQGRMFFDLPGSDRTAAARSIARLAALPVDIVHPGHGESFDGFALQRLAEHTLRRLEASRG